MKKIITFAAAAAMASPLAIATAAAGDLDIYGRVHMSVDHLDDDTDSSQYLFSNSSRLGVRGSEYLGMGLTGLFQYETAVDPVSGGGDLFVGGRDSYLGLTGDFGTLIGGRLSGPLKSAVDRTNVMIDQLGDAHNLLSTAVTLGVPGNNVRHNNVLAYVTPSFEGFNATFVYGPRQGTDKGDRFVIQPEFNGQVGAGNLFVALGYLRANEGVVNAAAGAQVDETHEVWQLVGEYKVAGEWRIMGVYQDYSQSDTFDLLFGGDGDDRVYGIGAGFYVAPSTELKGQVMFYDADRSNADSDMFALAVDHHLTDRTKVYANWAMIKNDDNVARIMHNYGHRSGTSNIGDEGTTPALGDDQWGVSFGLQHNF